MEKLTKFKFPLPKVRWQFSLACLARTQERRFNQWRRSLSVHADPDAVRYPVAWQRTESGVG